MWLDPDEIKKKKCKMLIKYEYAALGEVPQPSTPSLSLSLSLSLSEKTLLKWGAEDQK